MTKAESVFCNGFGNKSQISCRLEQGARWRILSKRQRPSLVALAIITPTSLADMPQLGVRSPEWNAWTFGAARR